MIRDMIRDPAVSIADIGAHLDGLDHAGRVAALDGLGRKDQAALYDKAASGPSLDLAHLVPPEVPDLGPVHHWGLNTLPLPGALKHFEKRFCRPNASADDPSGRLFGYNHGVTTGLLGPGYFVAYETKDSSADWKDRGTLVVDYFQVPDSAVSAGWPKVVPNSRGLQILVYNGTRDFLRGVSKHLSIGAAYKGEKKLHQYFLLLREDAGTVAQG